MKKFSIWKKLQLFLLVILTGISVYLALSDQAFYQNMQQHPTVFWVYLLIWVCLLFAYFFLFLDFHFLTRLKRDYHSLNQIAYSDHLSGIPNRFSCDVLLEKYANKPAPPNFACIMLEITNLGDTNAAQGHNQGNTLIQDFSDILRNCALALCFVGRNGGNKFLAVFEEATQARMDSFLARIAEKVATRNLANPATPLFYQYGSAVNTVEQQAQVNDLVALADSRLQQ